MVPERGKGGGVTKEQFIEHGQCLVDMKLNPHFADEIAEFDPKLGALFRAYLAHLATMQDYLRARGELGQNR